jgi:hypothetical protein
MNKIGRYSEYVICLFNYVYEQDSDIWERQPSNFSKAEKFAFGKNLFEASHGLRGTQ